MARQNCSKSLRFSGLVADAPASRLHSCANLLPYLLCVVLISAVLGCSTSACPFYRGKIKILRANRVSARLVLEKVAGTIDSNTGGEYIPLMCDFAAPLVNV